MKVIRKGGTKQIKHTILNRIRHVWAEWLDFWFAELVGKNLPPPSFSSLLAFPFFYLLANSKMDAQIQFKICVA